MPILGFILACTVILAGGLFGISAVLNAPPMQQANSVVTSPAAAEQNEPSKKESEVSANRARLAQSLTRPVAVKRELTGVEAADQSTKDVSKTPETLNEHSVLKTASTPSTGEFLGRVMSVPPTPPSTAASTGKSDDAAKKHEEAPEIANSAPNRGPVAEPSRKDRVAKDKQRPSKDIGQRPIKENTKRKAVAKRAPIPSKEELDALIGFEPSPSQEVVVYRVFE